MIPPTPRRHAGRCARSPRRCASPSSGSPTCAPSAAANRVGAQRLAELAERHGRERLRAGMAEILAYAERRTRAALADLPDGTYAAEDVLEDDAGGEPRDVAPAGRGDDRRRPPDARLRRHRPAGRRATSTARSR